MPTSMNDTASHWTARFRAWRDPVVSLFLIVAASVVIIKNWPWSTTTRPPTPNFVGKLVALTDSPSKGDPNAGIGIVVFADFQCPYCSRFAKEIMPRLEETFVAPGIAQLVFKHFPLPSHKSALVAAQGAACAQQFGKFWDVHDRLFDAGASLDRDRITGIGALLGLSPNWQQCVDSTESRLVSRDRSEGASLGVRSTPTILMGSVLTTRTLRVDAAIEGARPFTDFEKQLNKLKAGAH
jgi:protein-disulfide isomerase